MAAGQIYPQELKRKGSLGIELKVKDSIAGIFVVDVLENTTASAIGIQPNDILVAIGQDSVLEAATLLDLIDNWREGDPVEIRILREGKKMSLSGNVAGKPYETSQNGIVIYDAIPFDGGQIRSILELPKNTASPPVVLYLPGVGCASYDFGSEPNHPIKLLVESLVDQGIAVFRMEKPGMGDSHGTTHCQEMDYDYEINAYAKALEVLKRNSKIDTNRIFLFGESLGTITAPYVAVKQNIAGIIAWGGIVTSWFEYYMRLQRDQKILLGEDYQKMDEDFRKNLPFFYDFLIQKLNPNQLRKNTQYQSFVDSHFKENLWHGLHHYTYFQNLNDKNILSTYKEANCPVLALAGEYDIHTADTTWAIMLSDAINHYTPGRGSYKILEETTHHYYKVPSVEVYIDKLRNGKITPKYMSDNFNDQIGREMGKWINNN